MINKYIKSNQNYNKKIKYLYIKRIFKMIKIYI